MEEGLRVIKGVLLGCTKTAGESRSEAAFNSAWIKSSILNIHLDMRKWRSNLVSGNIELFTDGSVIKTKMYSPVRLFCPSRSCRCNARSLFLLFECGSRTFLSRQQEELEMKRKSRLC